MTAICTINSSIRRFQRVTQHQSMPTIAPKLLSNIKTQQLKRITTVILIIKIPHMHGEAYYIPTNKITTIKQLLKK